VEGKKEPETGELIGLKKGERLKTLGEP